jgi:transcriptional regulator with XRE-family HTH domain
MSELPNHTLSGVRARRELRKITAKQCAQAIGIVPNSFGRIERGERILALPKALTLARLLGCTVEELGQEPSIEERVLALRAQQDAEMAALLEPTQPRGPGRPAAWTPEKAKAQAIADAQRERDRVDPSLMPITSVMTGEDETLEQREARLRAMVEGAGATVSDTAKDDWDKMIDGLIEDEGNN